jgi:hypothetical protein
LGVNGSIITTELVALDGSNYLYISVLELLEPRLSAHAIVLADMTPGDLHHDKYEGT